MDELARVRETFAEDRFAADMGAQVERVGDKYALCSLTLDARHRNARGGVMGGAMFTLADFAFAVAANHGGQAVVTMDADVRFLASPHGDVLTAEARCIRDGRSTCCYQVEVKDGDRLAALVTMTGMHVGA